MARLYVWAGSVARARVEAVLVMVWGVRIQYVYMPTPHCYAITPSAQKLVPTTTNMASLVGCELEESGAKVGVTAQFVVGWRWKGGGQGLD